METEQTPEDRARLRDRTYYDRERRIGERNAHAIIQQIGKDLTFSRLKELVDIARDKIEADPGYWGGYYKILHQKLSSMEHPDGFPLGQGHSCDTGGKT